MNYFEKVGDEVGRKVSQLSLPTKELLAKEGRLISLSYNNTGFILPSQVISGADRLTATTFATLTTITIDVPPGEAWIGGKFRLSVDRPCFYDGYITQGSHITQSSELGGFTPCSGVFGSNGGYEDIELPYILYEGGRLTISIKIPGTVAKPIEHPIVTIKSISGISITNDFNFQAKNVILSIGDSISWAGERLGFRDNSLFKLSGKVMYDHRIADALRSEGKSVRLIKKGFGSMVQSEADRAYENGWYDGIDYDLLICNRGTNDVPNTITPEIETAFKNSLKKVIVHRNVNRPNASIIFIAPFNSDSGANRVANLTTIRQWVQDVANDPVLGTIQRNVYFYDGSTAFSLNSTAANDINFAQGTAMSEGGVNTPGERATGSRLHLGEYGHLAAFTGLLPVVKSTQFYQIIL